MSLDVSSTVAALKCCEALHAEAVALLRVAGFTPTVSPPHICLPGEEYASLAERGAELILSFETTGDLKLRWLDHKRMRDVLCEMKEQVQAIDSSVAGVTVYQLDRMVTRLVTDDDPGPVCDEDDCSCCGGPYVDREHYCKFVIYMKADKASGSGSKRPRSD